MYESHTRAQFTNVTTTKTQRKTETPTWLQEALLTTPRKAKFSLTDWQFVHAWVFLKHKSWSFSCWEASPDVAGGRSCSVVSMWMERGGGGGEEAGKGFWLVRTLLRWNKPRLRNDIFSHPSNKLYIQQIAGTLPNHFFPLQSLKSCI